MAWILAGCYGANSQKSSPDWGLLRHGSLDAVVNAIAHIHIETPWLTKERFVAGGAVAIAVAGRFLLGIRLRFHNHAPQQLAMLLAFHQQAADEVGGDLLGGAGEEGLVQDWEALGGRGGYGSGLMRKC